MKFNHRTFLAVSFAAILLPLLSAVSEAEPSPRPDTPEAALSRIRAYIEALLRKPQPELVPSWPTNPAVFSNGESAPRKSHSGKLRSRRFDVCQRSANIRALLERPPLGCYQLRIESSH